jgi:hypothetical protein
VKLWSKGSKTNFKIRNIIIRALIASRPSLDFRLKRLPTIQDFLEDTINTEVVTQDDRTRFHHKLYSQTPILEVINVEKEFFLQVSLEKNQDLKR